VEGSGGQIAAFESYITNTTDFTEPLGRIREAQPDLLYLPNFFQEAKPIAIQARKMGIKAILMGSEAFDRDDFSKMAEFEGAYMTAHWSSDLSGEPAASFIKKYEERFGITPEDGAAITYDALEMLLAAIREQGAADPESIRNGLYEMGPYQGVTGKIDFIDSGDPLRDAVILQFRNGTVSTIKRLSP
jgi:branched-chain amino acid transport system substrate-binding protein